MSFESERVYLTQKIVSRESEFGFKIAYPNHPFDVPKNETYGEFFIVAAPQGVPISGEGTGLVRMRRVGFVQLTIWIPNNSGTKPATLAGDLFGAIFAFKLGRDSDGNSYKFKGAVPVPTPDKNGWTCLTYRVSYQRDSLEQVQIS